MNFGDISKVCLIGGGEPMVHCAQYLKRKNIDVHVILAPRHEDSELPLSGQILKDALAGHDIGYTVTADINDPAFIKDHLKAMAYSLALCFGPAWVFNGDVLAAFHQNIMNFNGIPVPHYLGGAHYTWQILNGNKTSGMTIQMITPRVDRGDILKYEQTQLPDYVRTPQDYYKENFEIAARFLENFCDELLDKTDFEPTRFDTHEPNRLYFPRLLTLHQAWIDWSWAGRDIEKFCCAFDQPYPGASTYIKDQRVFLKAVSLENNDPETHPFCSGLVIRKYNNKLYLAVLNGTLVVENVLDEAGDNIINKIREGDRFYTPYEDLLKSKTFRPVIGSEKPK